MFNLGYKHIVLNDITGIVGLDPNFPDIESLKVLGYGNFKKHLMSNINSENYVAPVAEIATWVIGTVDGTTKSLDVTIRLVNSITGKRIKYKFPAGKTAADIVTGFTAYEAMYDDLIVGLTGTITTTVVDGSEAYEVSSVSALGKDLKGETTESISFVKTVTTAGTVGEFTGKQVEQSIMLGSFPNSYVYNAQTGGNSAEGVEVNGGYNLLSFDYEIERELGHEFVKHDYVNAAIPAKDAHFSLYMEKDAQFDLPVVLISPAIPGTITPAPADLIVGSTTVTFSWDIGDRTIGHTILTTGSVAITHVYPVTNNGAGVASVVVEFQPAASADTVGIQVRGVNMAGTSPLRNSPLATAPDPLAQPEAVTVSESAAAATSIYFIWNEPATMDATDPAYIFRYTLNGGAEIENDITLSTTTNFSVTGLTAGDYITHVNLTAYNNDGGTLSNILDGPFIKPDAVTGISVTPAAGGVMHIAYTASPTSDVTYLITHTGDSSTPATLTAAGQFVMGAAGENLGAVTIKTTHSSGINTSTTFDASGIDSLA